jgi:hypothetical protein
MPAPERKPREFRCQPEWCAARRTWQYVWSCRQDTGPWTPCNFVADVDVSGKQAEALRKVGCVVTLEPVPAGRGGRG